MLPKVTTNLPFCPVPFNHRWKHLSNIHLANPNFGTTGSVDLLLGADVFSGTMLHGWRFGLLRSPSAFKTCFGWVLVCHSHQQSQLLIEPVDSLVCLYYHYCSESCLACAILDAPFLKDGNSKELRCLHDVANQHHCALKLMKYETSASFVMSILELNLDQATIKWQ